jgi:hypothetical protein
MDLPRLGKFILKFSVLIGLILIILAFYSHCITYGAIGYILMLALNFLQA